MSRSTVYERMTAAQIDDGIERARLVAEEGSYAHQVEAGDLAQVALALAKQCAILKNFMIEASYFVPSDAASKNGSLEGIAIRSAWLKALHAIEMTEEKARELARGAWKRGLAAL